MSMIVVMLTMVMIVLAMVMIVLAMVMIVMALITMSVIVSAKPDGAIPIQKIEGAK